MKQSDSNIATASTETGFLLTMNSRQKSELAALVTIWLAVNAYFWIWWLSPEHNVDNTRYLINTTALLWTLIMPAYYLFFLCRLRIPNSDIPLPTDLRVAMVVTKVPSEPFTLVKKTLEAMLSQQYPHDTWLADEQPADETIAWCKANHVRISTRFGNTDYHNKSWPRRTKCKEGNLTYFYDHYGYDLYDIVVQLDADHVPESGYLEEMIRPFSDPAVGYVSAPSICDTNATDFFWARGRLYSESMLHGSLQAGHYAPLCIGSHYAVRTQALHDIGGLGPELAEDHSTSMFFNAGQWRGVHAINAEAHGEGPRTFKDMVIQEFQWSKSLVTILLRYSPRCMKNLPVRMRFQFLFSQLWYPLFTGFMLLLFLLPIIALWTKSVWVDLVFIGYVLRASLVVLSLLLILLWVRKNDWTRPRKCKLISWEGTLFLFARWPWALFGVIDAVICFLCKKESGFRVTPKESAAKEDIPVKILLPYVVLSIAAALPVVLLKHVGNATAFYFFSSFNALLYAVIIGTVIYRHETEQHVSAATLDNRR
jgi:cellulose synthase (UDP-forming)